MLSALLLSCWSEPAPDSARSDLPNIVLVSMDTVRRDHLTAYGYHRDTSPFLTALAEQGALFTNSYAQAPATLPTHASIFSGQYGQDHQVFGNDRRLEDDTVTLAEHLADHGYATFAAVSSMRFLPELGILQGFETIETLWGRGKNKRSDAVTDSFVEFAATESRPIFGFLHYFDVHAPYAPPAPFRTQFQPPRPDLMAPEESIDFIQANRYKAVSGEILSYLQGLYDGGIASLDDELKRMVSSLRFANGRSTLFIFFSDHGEAFKEHGYLGHSTWMYEELVQVPLLVVWAGRIAGGQRIDALAQSVDLYPTILDLIDLPAPQGLAGRSLAGPLTGQGAAPVVTVQGFVDVLPLYQSHRHWGVAATLGEKRLKLVKHKGEEYRLYRLDQDPAGDRDVIIGHQAEAAAMVALAEELGMPLDHQRKGLRKSGERLVNTREQEQLRALGYIDEVDEMGK